MKAVKFIMNLKKKVNIVTQKYTYDNYAKNMTEAKGIVGSSELFKKELFNEIVRNNGVDNKRGGNPIEEMTYNNKNKLNAELLRKSEAANSKIYNRNVKE
jgi:hypothetical protein